MIDHRGAAMVGVFRALHRKLKGPTVEIIFVIVIPRLLLVRWTFYWMFRLLLNYIRFKRIPIFFFLDSGLRKRCMEGEGRGGWRRRGEGGGEGERKYLSGERRISRSFYRSRGIFSRHARDFVVREDLLRVACELNSTHTRYFIPYRETLARQFSLAGSKLDRLFLLLLLPRFLTAEAIRYQNIFEQFNNLFHREGRKKKWFPRYSGSLKWYYRSSRELFEMNYLFIKIFVKRYFLMIFFFYIYISRQYAKNLFDDRCLLTFSGMDACFKLKLFQRYNE